MRNNRMFAAAVLLAVLALAGCGGGVSQDEFDRVSADLAAAQSQIASLQDDNEGLAADLAGAQGELASLKTTRDEARSLIELWDQFNEILIAQQTGLSGPPVSEVLSEIRDIRDPELRAAAEVALGALGTFELDIAVLAFVDQFLVTMGTLFR